MPNVTRAGNHRVRISLAAAAVGVGILVPTVYTIARIQTLQSSETQQAQRVSALSSALGGAQNQLKQNGIVPSQPAPSQIIGQAGPAGPQGSQGPGPSDAQVASGSPGPTGPPGPAPSGWVWTDHGPLGGTHSCSPTTGTPSPQYSCS
jgi:hypothetical protein